MPSSAHRQRLLTGLLLTAVLVLCLFLGHWGVFCALAFFSCWGLLEFLNLFWPGWRYCLLKAMGLVLCLLLLMAAEAEAPGLVLAVILAAFWVAVLSYMAEAVPPDHPHDLSSHLVLPAGILYVPAMLHFVLDFQIAEILFVLCAAFASDTGAYYAGTRYGRRKLWPRVSPKKTWEGSFGGLAACILVSLALGLSLGRASFVAFLALALVLNIAAQFGDLVESAIKRGLGVKDSGHLLPGHGGLLDRIDGLLFVVPVYAAARALTSFF